MILHLSHAVPLSESELSPVDVAICIDTLAWSSDLAVFEMALVTTAITHQEHTGAILLSVDIVSFVLEEGVFKSVDTLAVAELGNWV